MSADQCLDVTSFVIQIERMIDTVCICFGDDDDGEVDEVDGDDEGDDNDDDDEEEEEGDDDENNVVDDLTYFLSFCFQPNLSIFSPIYL